LSLFNIGGRFFWASLSDKIGRKNTYYTFFMLGIVLYAWHRPAAGMGSQLLFVLAFGIILSMYGGGFATIPAYLADIFGTQFVGAIHGRLLTAWATAGIVGPVVVNYIREFQIAAGIPREQVYTGTMYILAGMLVLGVVANALVQAACRQMVHVGRGSRLLQAKTAAANAGPTGSFGIGTGGLDAKAAMAWAVVGVPILWGYALGHAFKGCKGRVRTDPPFFFVAKKAARKSRMYNPSRACRLDP
jgi:MFS family permease